MGVDLDERVVGLAARELADPPVGGAVELRAVDVDAVLAAPPTGGLTAVWSSELRWPSNVGAPAATVVTMAGALAPGGVVASFIGNYHRSVFLPGRPRLDRLVLTASELAWGLPQDGPDHSERHLRWLADAGLTDIGLRVLPRVVGPGPDEAGRSYLNHGAFPELLASRRPHGTAAGMSRADVEEAVRLLDPESPGHVLRERGCHALLPTSVATGRMGGL